jgi:hypothetical protein
VAIAAYLAWTSNRYNAGHAAALRRIVSDLLRAKLDFDEAQAVKLIKGAVREGFSGSSYSPNSAVAGALKRHVDTRGLSPAVREALSGLRARMVHSRADGNSQGRKLIAAVEAMLAKEANNAEAVPRFRPKSDAWGKAIEAKLATFAPELRARCWRWPRKAARTPSRQGMAQGGGESACIASVRTRRHPAARCNRVARTRRQHFAGEPEHAARASLACRDGGAIGRCGAS